MSSPRHRRVHEVAQWMAEDLLRVDPLAVERDIEEADATSRRALIDHLMDRYRTRASLAGVPWGRGGASKLGAAVELLSSVRRRAHLVSCVRRFDDPSFFQREDWPLRALEVDETRPATSLVLRPAARGLARLAAVGLAGALGARVPVPMMDRILAAGIGATFNRMETRALLERLSTDRIEPLESAPSSFRIPFDLHIGPGAPSPLPA